MLTKIFYNVQNGGDGSAYPYFYTSRELADWDEDHSYEGWGESSVGVLDLKGESPVAAPEAFTQISYLFKLWDSGDVNLTEFVEKFFPLGVPAFEVQLTEPLGSGYQYNIVLVDGVQVAKLFKSDAESGEALAVALARLTAPVSKTTT